MSLGTVEAVLAAMPMPALVIDASARIVAANADARRLVGLRIVGRPFGMMLRQPAVLAAVEDVLGGEKTGGETGGAGRVAAYFSNDGTQSLAFNVHCKPMATAPDMPELAGMVLVSFEDVTQARTADTLRRDFVTNVSHELRTPLTAMTGFIETLQGPARDDAPARVRFLALMQEQTARMSRLVGDLLSLGRVENDERVRPKEQVALRTCLEGALKMLEPMATKAGARLLADLGDTDFDVPADRDQLVQAVTNLVENAVKYGGAGVEVTLRLRVLAQDAMLRGPAARIEVIDTGAGVDPVHVPRLTERFYRADAHRSRDQGGTGLGLAIVKHIVGRHRGRMRITSQVGKGTTVSIALPLGREI